MKNANYYYQYDNGKIRQGGLGGSTENDIYEHVEGIKGGLNKAKPVTK